MAHAFALKAVDSVKKDKYRGKIVLTAGAWQSMAEIHEKASTSKEGTKKGTSQEGSSESTVPTTGKKIKAVKVSKSTKAIAKGKKPHKFRPGMVALREIRKYQKII